MSTRVQLDVATSRSMADGADVDQRSARRAIETPARQRCGLDSFTTGRQSRDPKRGPFVPKAGSPTSVRVREIDGIVRINGSNDRSYRIRAQGRYDRITLRYRSQQLLRAGLASCRTRPQPRLRAGCWPRDRMSVRRACEADQRSATGQHADARSTTCCPTGHALTSRHRRAHADQDTDIEPRLGRRTTHGKGRTVLRVLRPLHKNWPDGFSIAIGRHQLSRLQLQRFNGKRPLRRQQWKWAPNGSHRRRVEGVNTDLATHYRTRFSGRSSISSGGNRPQRSLRPKCSGKIGLLYTPLCRGSAANRDGSRRLGARGRVQLRDGQFTGRPEHGAVRQHPGQRILSTERVAFNSASAASFARSSFDYRARRAASATAKTGIDQPSMRTIGLNYPKPNLPGLNRQETTGTITMRGRTLRGRGPGGVTTVPGGFPYRASSRRDQHADAQCDAGAVSSRICETTVWTTASAELRRDKASRRQDQSRDVDIYNLLNRIR